MFQITQFTQLIFWWNPIDAWNYIKQQTTNFQNFLESQKPYFSYFWNWFSIFRFKQQLFALYFFFSFFFLKQRGQESHECLTLFMKFKTPFMLQISKYRQKDLKLLCCLVRVKGVEKRHNLIVVSYCQQLSSMYNNL